MNPYGPLVGGFHHRGCSERDFLTSPLAGGAPRSDWVNDSPPKQRLSEAFSSNTADFMSMVDPCGTFHVLSKTTSRTLPPFSRIFVRPAVSLANRLRVGTPNHQTSVGTPVRPTWGGANGLHVHKVHDHIRRRPQKRNDETRRGEDI